jgi:polyhydroxybutyrate depolymerase
VIRRVVLFATATALALVALAAVSLFLILRSHRLQRIEAVRMEPVVAAGNYRWSLMHDGRERRYIVHVPEGLEAGRPVPLVLALHGGGGSGDRTDDLMKLTPVADRERFLVAFPDGIGKNWNDGRDDSVSEAHEQHIDDVGFLRALIDELASKLPVDPQRVYATGVSNGAMMSGRLACELSDRIAAVGLVVGTGPVGLSDTCQPSRPVPIIAFHGTRDPFVPYNGGTIPALLPWKDRGRVIGAPELKSIWLRLNGCSPVATFTELPDIDPSDGTQIVREAYGSCRAGADVVFHRVEGGGHTWPGGRQYLPERWVGKTNRDISASEVIWRFFSEHPLP